MSIPIIYNDGNLLFGADSEFMKLPILNLPIDTISVRRRCRSNEVWTVFVKTRTAILKYFVKTKTEKGLLLEDYFVGANTRADVQPENILTS